MGIRRQMLAVALGNLIDNDRQQQTLSDSEMEANRQRLDEHYQDYAYGGDFDEQKYCYKVTTPKEFGQLKLNRRR